MSRLPRIVIQGNPHLVAHRGRGTRPLFTSQADYRLYLALLATEARRFRTKVLAYALLPDRVHLLVVPADQSALAVAIGRTHALYARTINRAARRPRAWAPRFQSCPLDKELVPDAVCYIETRPVRAHLVRCPWRWAWSSAAAHVGRGGSNHLLHLKPMKWWIGGRWKEWLRDGLEPDTEVQFLRHTRRGWPLAPADRLRDWERWLGRPLRPRPLGRPRKLPPPHDPPIPFW